MEERAFQAGGEDRSKAGMMGGTSRESMVAETVGGGGGRAGLEGGGLVYCLRPQRVSWSLPVVGFQGRRIEMKKARWRN